MTKKNFRKGIDIFFGDGAENNSENNPTVSGDEQLKGEKKATFIIEVDQLEKMKALAFWERTTLKSILKQSLDLLFIKKELNI